MIRTAEDGWDAAALQAVGEADLIYLSGGKPAYLRQVLTASPLGAALRTANERGAIIAGCSAGAMVLTERQAEFRRGPLPWPLRWGTGLGLVAGVAVLPHYDAWPEPLTAMMALQAPRGITVLGLDETASSGSGRVAGPRPPRVTVWRGRHRELRRGTSSGSDDGAASARRPWCVWPDPPWAGSSRRMSSGRTRKQSE
jgi:putative intracellular protease/amidase